MAVNVGKTKASVPLFEDVFIRDEDVTAEITGLMQRLKIDANNLGEEAIDHPLLFARIAILAEEAASEAFFIKRKLAIMEAELDGKIRREATEDGGKKPTEGQIANLIVMDGEVTELQADYIAADRSARILNVLRQSLTHRREMLVELMRDQRRENAGYNSAGSD